MKNKLNYILCICFLAVVVTNAQQRKIEKANNYFENFDYGKAIDHYEKLVEDGSDSPEIYHKLAEANYFNANYEDAAKWYKMLFDSQGDISEIETSYRYAQSLRSIKEYKKSDSLMNKLNDLAQNDQRVKTFLDGRDYLERIEMNSGKYSIENININSPGSDFAPSFNQDKIVFSTTRDTSGVIKSTHSWNKKRFLNLYESKVSSDGNLATPIKLTKKINSKVHESSTIFTKDGKTVYFTRNNEKSGNFARDSKGVSRLKLYRADLINDEWKNIKPLPFNNKEYSTAHPALNAAEDKLYFSSDMPGTVGKSDLYVVDINEDGTYGEPKNLGKGINTESRETFPFVTSDDILYFASDGHPGLGGMDIFALDLNSLDEGYVVNIGRPINSIADDFSLIIDSDTKEGYFSSNRNGGQGDDDIYALVQLDDIDLKCNNTIAGVVKDRKTGELLANAKVILINNKREQLSSAVSEQNGTFVFNISCENLRYGVTAEKEGYESADTSFSNNKDLVNEDLTLLLTKVDKGAPAGTDLAQYLNIEPIYFDFDKWNIRPDAEVSLQKIIAYMNKYPNIKVRIGSHTDSRATKAYNIRLSNKRANSTMEYLIAKGINPNSLSAKGLGESMLTNGCSDNIPCSEDQHQQNRRSEFIVVD